MPVEMGPSQAGGDIHGNHAVVEKTAEGLLVVGEISDRFSELRRRRLVRLVRLALSAHLVPDGLVLYLTDSEALVDGS
jgi:hypothetical protein